MGLICFGFWSFTDSNLAVAHNRSSETNHYVPEIMQWLNIHHAFHEMTRSLCLSSDFEDFWAASFIFFQYFCIIRRPRKLILFICKVGS